MTCVGRVKTYEAIVKGDNVPPAGVPESFKVLIKELQSLALDIKVLSDTRDEIFINEDDDDDVAPIDVNLAGLEDAPAFAPIDEEEDDLEDFDDLTTSRIPKRNPLLPKRSIPRMRASTVWTKILPSFPIRWISTSTRTSNKRQQGENRLCLN
jgi:hypothetical protein